MMGKSTSMYYQWLCKLHSTGKILASPARLGKKKPAHIYLTVIVKIIHFSYGQFLK